MSNYYNAVIQQHLATVGPAEYTSPIIDRSDIADALALRRDEAVRSMDEVASEYLDLAALSPEDRRLFNHRILGGMATRLAMASSWVGVRDHRHTPLLRLSPDDRYEVLSSITADLAEVLATRLKMAGLGVDDLLAGEGQALRHQRFADRVPVPHSFVRSQVYAAKKREQSVAGRLARFGRYASCRMDSCMPVAGIDEPDSLLVQAFGRNSFTDSQLPEVVEMHRMQAGDDQAVWHILSEREFDPGLPNKLLAEVAFEKVIQNPEVVESPMQWEVAYALWQKDPSAYDRYRNRIHTLWPTGNFYPTYDVKADSLRVMDQLGLYNPAELAHPGMIVRAVAILDKLGVEPEPLAIEPVFDPASTQRQIRNRRAWIGREALTRVHHLLHRHVTF